MVRSALQCLDSVVDEQWDRKVSAHPGHDVFHLSAWTKTLAMTYGHKPCHVSIGGGADPQALIPLLEVNSRLTGRRGVSLPFSDFCTPLTKETCDTGAIFARLLEIGRARKWKHVELRCGTSAVPASACPAASYFVHTLDLRKGPDALFSAFDSAVRRAIRKAEKSDLQVEVTQSPTAMHEFYELHMRTRRQHGLPPQSLRFFVNVHKEVISRGLGFIVRVTKGGRPVASLVFLRAGANAIYKYGASDLSLQEYRGNNLAMWAALQYLCEQGAERVHFGRTSASEDGTRRFKLGWATREEVFHYYRYDLERNEWITAKDRVGVSGVHNGFFGRLPLFLNRFAGRVLYSHLD